MLEFNDSRFEALLGRSWRLAFIGTVDANFVLGGFTGIRSHHHISGPSRRYDQIYLLVFSGE